MTGTLRAHRLPCPADGIVKCDPDDCPTCDDDAVWFYGFSEPCPAGCDRGMRFDLVTDVVGNSGICRACADRPSWLTEAGRVALGCPKCGGSTKLGHFHEQGDCDCRDGYLVVAVTERDGWRMARHMFEAYLAGDEEHWDAIDRLFSRYEVAACIARLAAAARLEGGET